jgi:hypothetical protein
MLQKILLTNNIDSGDSVLSQNRGDFQLMTLRGQNTNMTGRATQLWVEARLCVSSGPSACLKSSGLRLNGMLPEGSIISARHIFADYSRRQN